MRAACYIQLVELATRERSVITVGSGCQLSRPDRLAVEEPLELRIGGRSLTITMRTPGDDVELALGFLYAEGVITSARDVLSARSVDAHVVDVELAKGLLAPFERAQRSFTTTSSCGVCGKTSLDRLGFARPHASTPDLLRVPASVIHALPGALARAQAVFERTGGLHASALFDPEGELLSLFEDVGRHNALDKLVGSALSEDRIPLRGKLLLVSGRASFELVQKAVMAEVPLLAAVGAPSSLAVELAEQHGMTLLGFVRDGRFNVYSGARRITELGRT